MSGRMRPCKSQPSRGLRDSRRSSSVTASRPKGLSSEGYPVRQALGRSRAANDHAKDPLPGLVVELLALR
jgi:hypothetical protein